MNTASMVEAAFAKVEELIVRIEQLTETFQLGQERRERRWVFDQQAVAGGTADVIFTPPPGVEWIVERVATTGGVGGAVAAYLDSIAPTNLVDYDPSPQINARALSGEGIHVPSGSPLIYHFFSQPAGTCTVRLRLVQLALGI